VGNCTAVGSYDVSGGDTEGLLMTETAGTWATGVEAVLPATPTGDPRVELDSVSCWSPGNCTAVGSYVDNSGDTQGLLLTESAGSWASGVQAGLPASPTMDPGVGLSQVSCASAGNCTAVGKYADNSGDGQGLLLTETAGQWATGVQAALPASPTGDPQVSLAGVSCASAGNCTAVGNYSDNAGNHQGLLLTETAGTWATGVQSPLPAAPTGDPGVSLSAVSCVAAGGCTATGNYSDNSSHSQGLLLTQSSGTWATGVVAPLPADANTNPDVGMFNVSCTGTYCAAVGDYDDTAGNGQVVLLSESGGTWAAAEGTMPQNHGTNPSGDLDGLSCPSPGNCVASGEYQDTAGAGRGILISAVAASPTLSLAAPASASPGSTIAASAISATLAVGSSPSGTITFKVFGPQSAPPSSCAGGGTTVGTAAVSSNGSYHPSSGFKPVKAGDYWWYASYDGDVGDNPAASACGSSMAKTVVDTGPPTIKLTAPSGGAKYVQGQVVRARYSCADPDGASDVASCAGPVASGRAISTRTTGSHRFTVTAIDREGEKASETVHYTVIPDTPKITRSGKVKTAAKGASVSVDPGMRLACPAHGSRCTAVLTGTVVGSSARGLKRGQLVIARAHFGVRAGRGEELTFRLTHSGAQFLRAMRHLKLKVAVSARAGHGKRVTTHRVITIKAP
jgi:hypothetical protein